MTEWLLLAALDPPDPVRLLAAKAKDRRGVSHLQVLHPDLDLEAPMRRLPEKSAPILHNIHLKPASVTLRDAVGPKV